VCGEGRVYGFGRIEEAEAVGWWDSTDDVDGCVDVLALR
jgi:hypothetical protein